MPSAELPASDAPQIAHKWRELEDLPLNDRELGNRRMNRTLTVWRSIKSQLATETQISEFFKQLSAEWAGELGHLEGIYYWDRGMTVTLWSKGLADVEVKHNERLGLTDVDIKAIILDQMDVIEGLMDATSGNRKLTKGYVKELHAALVRHQRTYLAYDSEGRELHPDLLGGVIKTQPNSPHTLKGKHEYCPPDHVETELERLVQYYEEHEASEVFPDVEAAWLHHRYTQIHPFPDGNGRVARTLAAFVMIKHGGLPFVVRKADEGKYFEVLQAADAGDLTRLINFFADLETEALNQAINAAEKALAGNDPKRLIEFSESLLSPNGSQGDVEMAGVISGQLRVSAVDIVRPTLQQLIGRLGASLSLNRLVDNYEFGTIYEPLSAILRGLERVRGIETPGIFRDSLSMGTLFSVRNDGKGGEGVLLLISSKSLRVAGTRVCELAHVQMTFEKLHMPSAFEIRDGKLLSEGREFIFNAEEDLNGIHSDFAKWLESMMYEWVKVVVHRVAGI